MLNKGLVVWGIQEDLVMHVASCVGLDFCSRERFNLKGEIVKRTLTLVYQREGDDLGPWGFIDMWTFEKQVHMFILY